MHLVYYPKFYITIVSCFPWVLQNGYALFLGGAGGGGGGSALWSCKKVNYDKPFVNMMWNRENPALRSLG